MRMRSEEEIGDLVVAWCEAPEVKDVLQGAR